MAEIGQKEKHHSSDCDVPQGKLRHLDLFQEAGFICYRGKEMRHPALSIPLLGKLLNRINLRFSMMTPQAYHIKVEPLELVNLPGSQWLFRTDRGIEAFFDSLNLHNLRFQPTAKGIRKAAVEKKIIHLWAHPHEFRTEKDFKKLRFVFERFAAQAKAGRLESITMANMARQALETYHVDSASTL